MEIDLPSWMESLLVERSVREGASPSVLVSVTLARTFLESCLVPTCRTTPVNRGLCRKHIQKVRYHIKTGHLDEGWCVRNWRLLPAERTASFTAWSDVETLETLPGEPPNDMADTRWIFGCPEAQARRRALQKATTS